MYYYIKDNKILAKYPLSTKEIYIPEIDSHITQEEFPDYGVHRSTTASVTIAEDEYIVEYSIEVQNGLPVQVPVIAKKTPEELKEQRLQSIADKRYEIETGGTVFNGIPIATDRTSQALITGAALAATIDPNYVCKWKTSAGFVTLDASTIIAVATAVRDHVQNAFNREAELVQAINDGTYTPDIEW